MLTNSCLLRKWWTVDFLIQVPLDNLLSRREVAKDPCGPSIYDLEFDEAGLSDVDFRRGIMM